MIYLRNLARLHAHFHPLPSKITCCLLRYSCTIAIGGMDNIVIPSNYLVLHNYCLNLLKIRGCHGLCFCLLALSLQEESLLDVPKAKQWWINMAFTLRLWMRSCDIYRFGYGLSLLKVTSLLGFIASLIYMSNHIYQILIDDHIQQ